MRRILRDSGFAQAKSREERVWFLLHKHNLLTQVGFILNNKFTWLHTCKFGNQKSVVSSRQRGCDVTSLAEEKSGGQVFGFDWERVWHFVGFWREARRESRLRRGWVEEMRNACPMPSLSCGRGIALHRCLTTRSVSCPPRPTATSSSSSSSSLSSLQHARNGVRLASATRRVEFSFARAFGGGGGRGVGVVFVGQETPTQWKRRSWSSVRPMSSLGKKQEEDGDAKNEVLKSVVEAAAGGGGELNMIGKPETCTADELHYVAVPGTAWRLALWRYLPNLRVILLIQPILFQFASMWIWMYVCAEKTNPWGSAYT